MPVEKGKRNTLYTSYTDYTGRPIMITPIEKSVLMLALRAEKLC
jgi:hypothetical protein